MPRQRENSSWSFFVIAYTDVDKSLLSSLVPALVRCDPHPGQENSHSLFFSFSSLRKCGEMLPHFEQLYAPSPYIDMELAMINFLISSFALVIYSHKKAVPRVFALVYSLISYMDCPTPTFAAK